MGNLKVTEHTPQSLDLTSQILVRAHGLGNPPALLLGSPPGQHCTDTGVAIKALFPFTEFVVLPWSRGPRRRMGHQIQALCWDSLGPSFSGKLSPPPPTLQPESPVTEGPSQTSSQGQS